MTNDSGAWMSYVIEAEGLAKRFGDTQALAGVDMAAEQGTVLALLGPNGAGKTTAVRVLATLLKPDAGQARICGYDVVADAVQVRQLIALTGQYASVDDELTGTENLIMIGRLLGFRRAAARARPGRCSSASTWPTRPGGWSRRTRAACGAGSTWPRACSASPRCCSSVPRTAARRSAGQQDAEEQGGERADAGQRAEHGDPYGAAGAGVQRRRDPRDDHHDQLHHQGRLVAAADLGPHRDDVPDAGQHQDAERGPGDEIEPAGGGARDVGPEAAQHGYQGRQRDLAADPDGGGQHVQEQPDGVPAHRQHRGSLEHPAIEAAQ